MKKAFRTKVTELCIMDGIRIGNLAPRPLHKILKAMDERELKGRSLTRTKTGRKRKILGKGAKTDKGDKKGVWTKIFYGSPAKRSGFNMCVYSASCALSCLGFTTGRLQMNTAQEAQALKTYWFLAFPYRFCAQLIREIVNHAIRCKEVNKVAAVRLNGCTDVPWTRFIDMDAINAILDMFLGVQVVFYDYTKIPLFSFRKIGGPIPKSYSLTFSIDEKPESLLWAKEWIQAGYNAAIVIRGEDQKLETAKRIQEKIAENGFITLTVQGSELINYKFPAINADLDDLRFRDPKGSIAVLHAKGGALKDTTGFVKVYQC